jgi:ATP-binding cassette subfamily B protein
MRRSRTQKLNDAQETLPRFSRASLLKAKTLFRYLRPYRLAFAGGLILLVISSLVFMIFPIASGEILNIATGQSEYGLTLDQIAIGLLVILLVQSGVSFVRVMLFTYLSEYTMADVRRDLYEKMVTLPLPFFESHRVGDLASRVSNDVQQLQDTLSLSSAEFIRQIIVLFAGIAYLVYKTPALSGVMFATFPVIVILALVFGRRIRVLSRQRQEVFGRTGVILEETLQSIQVVKTFTNELLETRRYRKSNEEVVQNAMRLGWHRAAFVSFIIAILFGAIFFVLWRGALMVQSGTMSPGDLVTFIAITAIIGGTMGGLADLYTQLLRAIGAAERVIDILSLEGEVIVQPPVADVPRVSGHIRFEQVRFAYPSRRDVPVLQQLDLEVMPGQKIALAGASGAGKSTVIQLLLRLYEADAGRIMLDGQPIHTWELPDYRRQFAIVPQEVMLFGGTIRDNILYGKPEATEEELTRAARQSYCLEFIEQFPEGFDTVVGERGIKLSGGQRQRIAIARAILRDPAILLLDEATSSLDAGSERIVQDALDNLLEGRTAIIIAHRLATIRQVDRIFVLDRGRIVESGTHEELNALPHGLYNRLASLQFADAMPPAHD